MMNEELRKKMEELLVLASLAPKSNEVTYHCAECKDIGQIIYKKGGKTFARQCLHPDPTGRRFGFPRGVWSFDDSQIPAPLMGFCKQLIPSAIYLLTMEPKRAQAVALHCCDELKAFRPRYIDMMAAPQDFTDKDDGFLMKYDASGLLVIDSVDRRLRPPQVRTLISLLHRKQDRPALLIGQPPSQWPNGEGWQALGVELYRRKYKRIGGANENVNAS